MKRVCQLLLAIVTGCSELAGLNEQQKLKESAQRKTEGHSAIDPVCTQLSIQSQPAIKEEDVCIEHV